MSNTGLKKFSEELKKQREEKEISLQQISSKTKIDLKFLKAIEENNFDVMPEVYMRAFIREYAATIGLDGSATLLKFDKYKSGETMATETPASQDDSGDESDSTHDEENIKEFDATSHSGSKSTSGDGMSKNQAIYLVTAAVVIIAVIIAYFVYDSQSTPEFITERQTDPPAKVEEQPKERFVEKEIIDQPDVNSTPIPETISVKVTASDTTWMRVLIDDTNTQEFMLYPNGAKDLTGKDNMKFLLGNSGGVQFWLNGENLNFQGKQGVIRNIKIDKNGLSSITPSGNSGNDPSN